MRIHEIITDLRKRIVSGEFQPGEALPKRQELLEQYTTSVASFQKCINQLIEEGFLTSRGTKGTTVCPNPPHQYQIGVVIPARRDSQRKAWDPFWELFLRETEAFRNTDPLYRFKFYYTSNLHYGDWDSLVEDAENHLLAGLFLLEHLSFPMEKFDVFRDLPVVLLGDMPFNYENVLPLCQDYCKMLKMGAERLREQGCKSIAVLRNPEHSFVQAGGDIIGYMKKAGFEIPEEHIQAVCLCPQSLPTTKNLVKLLFGPDRRKQPDGLVILNENLLPFAQEALTELKLCVGKDVKIVSHANLQRTVSPRRTVERIGIDISAFLLLVIGRITDYRSGNHSSQIMPIDLVWEEELVSMPYKTRAS